MVTNNYANAYKEVLVVINNLIKDDFEKIPKEYIEFLENNCNKDYQFNYDPSKPLSEFELLDESKYILFGLFEKFGATDTQKAKITAFKRDYNSKIEEQKREKYNPDNLFKESDNCEISAENTELTVKPKESVFKFIINKIKSIINKE